MQPKRGLTELRLFDRSRLLIGLSHLIALAIPLMLQRARDAYFHSQHAVSRVDASPFGVCEIPNVTARIISADPLIMHLENFFTEAEMRHLIQIAEPKFEDSRTHTTSQDTILSTQRTSSSAWVPGNDTIVDCILKRAVSFQGYPPIEHMEGLQVTRYLKGQGYVNHFDWGHPPEIMSNGRVSTFFGYLSVNCTDCGTRFPRIEFPWPEDNTPEHVCNLVECADDYLSFKAKAGSAVFWRNLLPNGTGDERMLHAGMPVWEGSKTGLNIWTREKNLAEYQD